MQGHFPACISRRSSSTILQKRPYLGSRASEAHSLQVLSRTVIWPSRPAVWPDAALAAPFLDVIGQHRKDGVLIVLLGRHAPVPVESFATLEEPTFEFWQVKNANRDPCCGPVVQKMLALRYSLWACGPVGLWAHLEIAPQYPLWVAPRFPLHRFRTQTWASCR